MKKNKIFTIISVLIISIICILEPTNVLAACSDACASSPSISNCSASAFKKYLQCVAKETDENQCESKKNGLKGAASSWYNSNKTAWCNYHSKTDTREFLFNFVPECYNNESSCTSEQISAGLQKCLSGNGAGTNKEADYTSAVDSYFKCGASNNNNDDTTDNNNNPTPITIQQNNDTTNTDTTNTDTTNPVTDSPKIPRRDVNSAGGVGTGDLTNPTYELKIYGESPCNNYQISLAVSVIAKVVDIIKIAVPIILVIMIIVDITKMVVGQDDSKNDKIKQLIIKRLISAIIVFFVVTIVQLVCDLVGKNSTDALCMTIFGNPWIH